MESKKLLKIAGLQVSFSNVDEITVAVNKVSFQLQKGETLGIVGESGSGKSVTSLSLMRLVPQPPANITADSIELFNDDKVPTDILHLTEKEMRNYRGNEIAMIFQEPMTSLNPVYTCGDQVMEVIQRHNNITKSEARERTLELFKLVELPRPEKMLDSFPHQLSGGQKQRVMITMAISCNPKLLIADEPTTALDVTVQKQILRLLKKLQREFGMGMIFITHDLGVVAEVADDILVMYRGNVVEQGPVKEIFRNPKHPYTKGLIACRPKLNEKPEKLPTIADFMEINAAGELIEMVFSNPESSVKSKINFNQTPLLKVQNLKTWFPVKSGIFGGTKTFVKAVDDVSFDVFPGETLGLVGESGCGKTTLGRSILRLVEPTSGNIIYKDQNIIQLNALEMRELRKSMQIIFQDPYSSLNPRTTIGNALMEPMRVHKLLKNDKQRKEKVISLLERVSLKADHFNRYPHEFSGGQRQRICIARALVMEPEFIICDESVSALDVSVQAQVLNLLNELKREFGFTYIFISHDLSVVKYMSDRMIVMNKGKIEEIGDAEEIYANPKSAYTQKLISSIPTGENVWN